MICPVCGLEYNGRNKRACSSECYARLRQHTRDCIVCGKSFDCPPSADTVTCSSACATENRRRKEESNSAALQRAHEALPLSPLTGRFETNVHAKGWVIRDPSGATHECRNLLNWLRGHADMLDGTPMQAWSGITRIKYSLQGKKKNRSYSWKGWTLVKYGE